MGDGIQEKQKKRKIKHVVLKHEFTWHQKQKGQMRNKKMQSSRKI